MGRMRQIYAIYSIRKESHQHIAPEKNHSPNWLSHSPNCYVSHLHKTMVSCLLYYLCSMHLAAATI